MRLSVLSVPEILIKHCTLYDKVCLSTFDRSLYSPCFCIRSGYQLPKAKVLKSLVSANVQVQVTGYHLRSVRTFDAINCACKKCFNLLVIWFSKLFTVSLISVLSLKRSVLATPRTDLYGIFVRESCNASHGRFRYTV